MMVRFLRSFIAVTALAVAAACTNVTDLSRTDADPGPLQLNAVKVDASGLEVVISEGRTVKRTRAQLEQDLTAAITREALLLSDPNGLLADVNVTIEKVYLAPLVERVVAGSSYIEGTVSVTNAADGSIIIAPTQVIGNSDTLRAIGALGAVGALANADVETDYQNSIDGYAKALIASLQASAEQ